MRCFNTKFKHLILKVSITLLPCVSYATNINYGLLGIADKFQLLIDIMSNATAFVISCFGLLAATAIWEVAGHMAGVKLISGGFIWLILIANMVGWLGYFAGACI